MIGLEDDPMSVCDVHRKAPLVFHFERMWPKASGYLEQRIGRSEGVESGNNFFRIILTLLVIPPRKGAKIVGQLFVLGIIKAYFHRSVCEVFVQLFVFT